MAPNHIVVIVHGIRTWGSWQEEFAALLRAHGTKVEIYKYGYFGLLSCLLPPLRLVVVHRFRTFLQSRLSEWEDCRVDIVAHSFGTVVVAHALRTLHSDATPRLNTLLFCGSVLKQRFSWEGLVGPNHPVRRLINECGTRDTWPLLASIFVLGMGASGRRGFWGIVGPDVGIINRYFPFGHSDFVRIDFMEKEWVPLLISGAEPSGRSLIPPTPSRFASLEYLLDPAKLTPILLLSFFLLRTWNERNSTNEAAELASISSMVLRNDGSGSGSTAAVLLAATSLSIDPTPRGIEMLHSAWGASLRPGFRVRFQTGWDFLGRHRLFRALATTPSGKLIGAGTAEAAYVYSYPDLRQRYRIQTEGHAKVAVSGDDRLFASADDRGIAVVRDAATGAVVKTLVYGDSIRVLTFSDDGRFFGIAGGKGLARVWDTSSWREMPRLEPPDVRFSRHDSRIIVYDADLSPDGTWLAVGSNGLRSGLWHVPSGRRWSSFPFSGENATIDGLEILSVDFSGDGRWLAGGAAHGSVRVWELASVKPDYAIPFRAHSPFEIPLAAVTAVVLNHDGTGMLTGERDGTIRKWRLRPTPSAWERGLSIMGLVARAWSASPVAELVADRHLDLILAGTDTYAESWSHEYGQARLVVSRHPDSAAVSRIVSSPDGAWVALISATSHLTLWKTGNWARAAEEIFVSPDEYVIFGADSRTLITAAPADSVVRIWSVPDLFLMAEYHTSGCIADLASSDRDPQIALQTADHISVVNVVDGSVLFRIGSKAESDYTCVYPPTRLSRNARHLAVARRDSSITMWSSTADSVLSVGWDRISTFAFSPSGDVFAVSALDGGVDLLRVPSGRRMVRLSGARLAEEKIGTFGLASPVIATTSSDSSVRVWDSGREVARIRPNSEHPLVAFAGREDRWLLVADSERDVVVFEWIPEELVGSVCRAVAGRLTPTEWARYAGDRRYRSPCSDRD
jgi:WD40 repeat protein